MTNITLNLYKGFTDTSGTEITLENLVTRIREDASLRTLTEKFRFFTNEGDTRAAEYIKKNAPCFAVAVRLDGGKQEKHISGWTKLTMADFDHLPPERLGELKALATQDEHTLLAYVTISGCGLRILSRVKLPDENKVADSKRMKQHYLAAFEQMNSHYARLLGFPTDLKCKNATRLSVMAHDTEVWFNAEAIAFGPVQVITKQEQNEQKKLHRAWQIIEHDLAAQGFTYAKGERNNYIMRTGYRMNAFGISQKAATAWAVKQFDDYDGDVEGIFTACYAKSEEHGTLRLPTGNDSTWATIEEVEAFITTQARLRYNTIRAQVEIAWHGSEQFAPITDRDENTLWCRMCKAGWRVRLPDVRNVIHSEYIPLYNPFDGYFSTLPEWDGTDYIAQLADRVHINGDHDLFTLHLRKWLVAMVASLLREEVVNHEILVFIGRQGNYKSTFFNQLLPPELQSYFYTKTNNNRLTKDDMLTLSEFAIICLEEIDELRPSELNQLKAMVTLKTINERASYGRNKERRPHVASFCGTGNNPRFLTDPTGNRRWIAVEVLKIDNPHANPIPYEGVYSQALALFKQGFRYWFDPDETDQLNRQNEAFEASNLEEELIRTHFRRPFPSERGIFATTAHILASINYGLREPLSPTRVGLVMKKLGYESVRHNGGRGYRVVELTGDEIYNQRKLIARETLNHEG